MKRIRLIAFVIMALLLATVAVGTACVGGNGGNGGNGQTATWHHIATFSGTGHKTTDSFYIPGEKWRITWTATPDPDAIEFEVGGDLYAFAYPEGETALYVGSLMQTGLMATDSDTTYIYEGQGKFLYSSDNG